MMITYVLSFMAGLLTVMSPCVLPMLPITIGSSIAKHRKGPMALALGLIISFTSVGFILSAFGHAIGLSPEVLRKAGIIILIFFGLVLVIPYFNNLLSSSLTPLANKAAGISTQGHGLGGQFFIGLTMGAVWSPCVGPTLGAALSMASQKEAWVESLATMFIFSVGAVIPILIIAYVSRSFFSSRQSHILEKGHKAKKILGTLLIISGVFMLTGWDKILEATMLDAMPDAWLELITKF